MKLVNVSIHPSICSSFCSFIQPFCQVCLSTLWRSIHPSTNLSVHAFICSFVHHSIHFRPVCLIIHPSLYLSIHLCVSICISVHPSAFHHHCPSVCKVKVSWGLVRSQYKQSTLNVNSDSLTLAVILRPGSHKAPSHVHLLTSHYLYTQNTSVLSSPLYLSILSLAISLRKLQSENTWFVSSYLYMINNVTNTSSKIL